MATLVLVARSAAASAYEAQRLLSGSPLGEAARFLEAVALAGHRDNELMYNFGDAAAEAADGLDADAVAQVLHAHALLQFRNDRVLERLEATLFELMRQSKATAAALGTSVWSLARLHAAGLAAAPAGELLDAVSRMASQHSALFAPQQLCQVLDAYAVFRLQGTRQGPAMLSSVASKLAGDIRSVSPGQCAGAARALAKCRLHDERLLAAVAGRLRDRDARAALDPDVALFDLLSVEARRKLHLMGVPLISGVLASFAKAGVSCQVLAARAAAQLKRQSGALDAASAAELTVLAMAFGKLQARDGKLFEALGDALMRRRGPAITEEPCVMLANIVHAFTKVHAVHTELFGAASQALLARFEELSMQDMVKFLHGIAKVEYLMNPILRQRVAEALNSDRVDNLGVFELLKLATAARRLGIDIPALEGRVKAVLPCEPGGESGTSPGRAPVRRGVRRTSARKRKWTW
ncbi:unnamed protein product [Prorocentrum cordatum]|uniref:Uncharacterized protein n=1 Tax=Prorocentrum cordatum TaxID=2364126 RepID=A0ABN9RTV1_9DINO|nr:unnamed protein product [Polarella glacialis]